MPSNHQIKVQPDDELHLELTGSESTLLLQGISISGEPASNKGGIRAPALKGRLILDNVVYEGNSRPIALNLADAQGAELFISDSDFIGNANNNQYAAGNGSAVFASNIEFNDVCTDHCQPRQVLPITVHLSGTNR